MTEAPAMTETDLRKEPVITRLLDGLAAGEDIGHYGRLTLCMVARHFLDRDDLINRLSNDRDFSREEAESMLAQVEERDYNPPRRERLLEWQSETPFRFMVEDDPDSGNLYRHLKFPKHTYNDIQHYEHEKATASAE